MKALAIIACALVAGTPSGLAGKWCQSIDLVPTGKFLNFTANDLPNDGPLSKHRRYNEAGTYRVFVNAHGRVKRCDVLISSGESALDHSGCTNIKRRARFNPLKDPACLDVMRVAEYEIRFAWDHDVDGAEKATGIRQLR